MTLSLLAADGTPIEHQAPSIEEQLEALKDKITALASLSSILRNALRSIHDSLPAENDDHRNALSQLIEMTPEQALAALRGENA